jgi:uncharacterized phage protein (TIGR02216 family)
MALGLGVMAIPSPVFWAMTPRELDAALRGRFGSSPQTGFLSQHDLAQLMQQFPD